MDSSGYVVTRYDTKSKVFTYRGDNLGKLLMEAKGEADAGDYITAHFVILDSLGDVAYDDLVVDFKVEEKEKEYA